MQPNNNDTTPPQNSLLAALIAINPPEQNEHLLATLKQQGREVSPEILQQAEELHKKHEAQRSETQASSAQGKATNADVE